MSVVYSYLNISFTIVCVGTFGKKFKGITEKKDPNKENAEKDAPVNRKGVLMSLVTGESMEIPENDVVS